MLRRQSRLTTAAATVFRLTAIVGARVVLPAKGAYLRGMMRREVIFLLVSGFVEWPLIARAQQGGCSSASRRGCSAGCHSHAPKLFSAVMPSVATSRKLDLSAATLATMPRVGISITMKAPDREKLAS